MYSRSILPGPSDNHVLLQGGTFAIFDQYGDIQPYWSGEQGLFHRDTRYLSKIVAAHLRRPAAVAEFECS